MWSCCQLLLFFSFLFPCRIGRNKKGFRLPTLLFTEDKNLPILLSFHICRWLLNIPNEKKRTTVFILRHWLLRPALRVSISLGYRFQMYYVVPICKVLYAFCIYSCWHKSPSRDERCRLGQGVISRTERAWIKANRNEAERKSLPINV
jgi:hypothetical protein